MVWENSTCIFRPPMEQLDEFFTELVTKEIPGNGKPYKFHRIMGYRYVFTEFTLSLSLSLSLFIVSSLSVSLSLMDEQTNVIYLVDLLWGYSWAQLQKRHSVRWDHSERRTVWYERTTRIFSTVFGFNSYNYVSNDRTFLLIKKNILKMCCLIRNNFLV